MRWLAWAGSPEQRAFSEVIWRRSGWFLERLTPGKLANMVVGGVQYAAKSEVHHGWPVALKIDISPLCNLRCTTCIHADPGGNPALEKQVFHSGQLMTLAQYSAIIGEIAPRSAAVSLDYLGDPLMHPDLCEMCRIAHDAGLNVHISTSFSFSLTDARIAEIVKSGLTHLTVCVDGLSQQKYQLTRVGGRIDTVLSNLERICGMKHEYGQARPRVEVQYIRFKHNVDELERAGTLFHEMGVEQVTSFWGSLHNYVDVDPGTYSVHSPRRKQFLPRCFWPYFCMLIKYNGDVLPCCEYRIGEQYARDGDVRSVGNVFETSVGEVWNSAAYRSLRRLVANPAIIESEPSLDGSFCYGCPGIFNTDRNLNLRNAEHYAFEDLYEAQDGGPPVRISDVGTTLPASAVGRDIVDSEEF